MMTEVETLCKAQARKFKELLDYESAYWWSEKWLATRINLYNQDADNPIVLFSTRWMQLKGNIIPPSLQEPLEELVSCLIHNGELARAIHFVSSNGLHINSKKFFLTLLHCQVKLKDWDSAEQTIMDYEDRLVGKADTTNLIDNEDPVQSRILHLKALVFGAQEKRELATETFTCSVQSDIHAIASLMALSRRKLLPEKEAETFLETTFRGDSGKSEISLQPIYEKALTPHITKPLHKNLLMTTSSIEHHVSEIEQLVANHETTKAICLSSRLSKIDPYDDRILLTHISLLTETGEYNDLYKLGHLLIELDHENWVGWYCAGCYYMCVKKMMKAIDMFRKALTKNANYGHAFLALGHVFSEEKEHDQAMNSYLSAQRVMRGSALPELYVGLAYSSTGNYDHANSFLKQAYECEPHNPLVLHEIGTNCINLGQYELAQKYLELALQRIEVNLACKHTEIAPHWASLLFNLGTCLRKIGEVDQAVEYQKRALRLSSHSAEAHTILATTLSIKGDLFDAVEQLQYALTYNRQDQFISEMLNTVMNELSKEDFPHMFSDSSDDDAANLNVLGTSIPSANWREPPAFVTPQNRPRLQSTPRDSLALPVVPLGASFDMSIDEGSTLSEEISDEV